MGTRNNVNILGTLLIFAFGLPIGLGSGQTDGMKDFGNRLEGTTIQLNALNDFTFVALHRHFEHFAKGANLKVRFFLPRLSTGDNKVFLEALELQDSFHYFMTAKKVDWKQGASNVFHPWPTSDVIDRLDIAADNLGVRASYQVGKRTRVYLPVDVYSSNVQSQEQGYMFYYVTAQDLQSVDITVMDSNDKAVSIAKPNLNCNKKRNPNCIIFPAGNTFNFSLDFSALAPGEYHLHLVGHVPRTAQTTSIATTLYHDPRMEKAP